jgi:hypothetical protein
MQFIPSRSRLCVHYVEQRVIAVRFEEMLVVFYSPENHVKYRKHSMRKAADILIDTPAARYGPGDLWNLNVKPNMNFEEH